MDWGEIAARYEQFRLNSGCKQTTYDRDERYKITNTLELLAKPKRAPRMEKRYSRNMRWSIWQILLLVALAVSGIFLTLPAY